MRLSHDKARQLTALVWRQRARRWLPVLAVLLAMIGVFALIFEKQIERVDRTVEIQVHNGTVINVKRPSTRGGGIVHVQLDDGRDVDAFTTTRLNPLTGAHVVINEARHASGRLTYDVVRLAE